MFNKNCLITARSFSSVIFTMCITTVRPYGPTGKFHEKGIPFASYINGPLTRQINWGLRMRRECRERFPQHRSQRKPLISDPSMYHGTCVTHVPWCMSGPLTRGGGKNVPGIPGACAIHDFTYLVRGPLLSASYSSRICGDVYMQSVYIFRCHKPKYALNEHLIWKALL